MRQRCFATHLSKNTLQNADTLVCDIVYYVCLSVAATKHNLVLQKETTLHCNAFGGNTLQNVGARHH